MLKPEANELLTRVGPGTRMGELLRRYWHPVAATVQLDDEPVRSMKLLGESLVLFRDRQGRIGLIGDRCAHRAMHLRWGIPEAEGLRCPYHGWMYDATGQCVETPLEGAGSRLARKVKIDGYPVQEMGGLVWAYLGPDPLPLLPRWDIFVMGGAYRQILGTVLDCNWLQCMENRLDTMHGIYLHGNFFQYILERGGRKGDALSHLQGLDWQTRTAVQRANRPHAEQLLFERYEYGIDKHVVMDTGRVDQRPPMVFPYAIGHAGGGFRQTWQIGVPMDDTHTLHLSYYAYVPHPNVEVPKQDRIGYADHPLFDENGKPILDYVLAQDMIGWWAQGDITDRTKEKLGQTDTGIIMYRRLLMEQLDILAEGGDPMNVFRDPEKNVYLTMPESTRKKAGKGLSDGSYRQLYHEGYYIDDADRYCPDLDVILELSRQNHVAGGP
ncbi:MAG: Rieske 2Fe-2S domain-containing protein [Chloroflexi bacterium]|nr:Rieske 2Fe-2S domain-containing protein [Chloroflexota bacterium]